MKTTLKAALTGVTVVVAAGLALSLFGLPGIANPFRTETVTRDHAAVLRSLEDLSEYHAASGEYQVVVDIEETTQFVPGFLKGERTTFLAQGSVDAYVELGAIDEDSVIVGDSGTVTVILPPARLDDAEVDHEASAVLDRDRGVIDRVGGVFSDSPTSDRGLYLEAESRLESAAAESDLLAAAEDNTASMIEELFTSAGFHDVRVLFRADADLS